MGSSPRRSRPRRILDIVGAACAALLAFTAVPIVLVVIVGNPLGGGLGHDWRPLPQAALCCLVLAAWVAWAACCAQLLRAVVAHVRTGEVGLRRARRCSTAWRHESRSACSPSRASARPSRWPPARAPACRSPMHPSPQRRRQRSLAGPGPVAPATGSATDPLRLPATTYVVRPGDTLWRIAAEQLGDGADWTSLARLNLGRDLGGGARFVDPDQLREGLAPAAAHRCPALDRLAMAMSMAASGTDRPSPGHLPELVALGLGSVACAALARRARRRRRLGAQFSAEPLLPPDLSEGAQDAATLLQRFDGVPALGVAGSRQQPVGARPGGSPAPTEGARRSASSPSGVTFCFADAQAGEPPHGFSPAKDGAAWHVSHDALEGHDPCFPHLPVLLPVGDDDEGTWLVPLEPGDVLPLLGEAAPALWRAARGAVGSWAWSETVLVTEDPRRPGAARRDPRRPFDRSARALLWRPGRPSPRSRRSLRGGHDGTGCGQRPDRARRSPGRNPASHGSRRSPSSPIVRNGPAHCGADRAAPRTRRGNDGGAARPETVGPDGRPGAEPAAGSTAEPAMGQAPWRRERSTFAFSP